MKQIKIRASITSKETKRIDKVEATYEEKKYIYYIEKGKEKTVTIYNLQNDTLERDNEEMYLYLPFKTKEETLGTMIVKDINQEIKLEIYTKEILKNKKEIKIRYTLNDEQYTYKLEYGEENT